MDYTLLICDTLGWGALGVESLFGWGAFGVGPFWSWALLGWDQLWRGSFAFRYFWSGTFSDGTLLGWAPSMLRTFWEKAFLGWQRLGNTLRRRRLMVWGPFRIEPIWEGTLLRRILLDWDPFGLGTLFGWNTKGIGPFWSETLFGWEAFGVRIYLFLPWRYVGHILPWTPSPFDHPVM